MKIGVIGMGYVGLANALALASANEVWGVDIDQKRIDKLNQKVSPLNEDDISEALKSAEIHFNTDIAELPSNLELVIIATPTDYNEETDAFDTSSIESVIRQIDKLFPGGIAILIRSTIPVGYTAAAQAWHPKQQIAFSPEFLREGSALTDILNPSRIIIGRKDQLGKKIGGLYSSVAQNNAKAILMDSQEAEAVKLFANTFLANRVAFFNELDTYARIKGLDTKSVIDGISSDPRIGDFYNNPSFGFGGYCLPKDSKQLASSFDGVPHALISAIVESNKIRKQFITHSILDLAKPGETVGIYRLVMKAKSDNFRQSSILDIIQDLYGSGIAVQIYEPLIQDETYLGIPVIKNSDTFFAESQLIITNRNYPELKEFESKIFTTDLFGVD